MIDGPYRMLALLGSVTTGVMAGVFCAFSVLVMRGLAKLPAAQGVAAMNAMNASALTPVFMVLFLGSAGLCAGIAVVTFLLWPDEGTLPLLLGSGLYLVGAFGVTVMANVPRNETLMKLGPGTPEAEAYWPAYVRGWTRWNHVRVVASAAAAIVYALALV
ncbi:DUF1772 domain-containing protein [Streptomyces sp. T028]|uniref:anthrone oxygenase family protein n=1 Tax=Streptomyces sp. T028 TaxID=3394379 RepID=UPI003A84BA6D